MVKNYTDKQLLTKVKSLPSFKAIPSGFWILGVQSAEDVSNTFDDKFYLFEGERFVMVTTGTTNAGKNGMLSYEAQNPAGVAVLKTNEWYYNVWHFGKHQGKVDALLQLGAPVEVYRDTDKDDDSEEQGVLDRGYFGINFHPNTYKPSAPKTNVIGWWSAGCQVVNDLNTYKRIITMCKPQKVVSYCLINEFE
jgi:hypothetical protein